MTTLSMTDAAIRKRAIRSGVPERQEEFEGIIRQLRRLELAPLTKAGRAQLIAALQLVIDGAAKQSFG